VIDSGSSSTDGFRLPSFSWTRRRGALSYVSSGPEACSSTTAGGTQEAASLGGDVSLKIFIIL
jgi:hypothetical protein